MELYTIDVIGRLFGFEVRAVGAKPLAHDR